jgi:DNA-binding CsgD family transcriptional regulator
MTIELIGRDEELAAIDSFLDEAAPAALVLHGDAGIGKTTLWRTAVARARAHGYRVLEATPAGAEARLAFACLGDLLGHAFEEAADSLPPPQRHALAAALLLEEAGPGALDERAVAVAFLGALRTLSAAGRVVVAVDDIQWADAPSAAVLEFVIRRLGNEEVRLVLARRTDPDEDGALPLELARSPLGERTSAIPVGPLSLGALHRLLHQRLGTTFPRPTLTRLHQTSGGNPFYALQLAEALRHAAGEPTPGDPLPVPGNLRELVAARLARVAPSVRETLLAAAALGRPSLMLLERAAPDAARDVEEAAAAGIVELRGEDVAFTHPLLGSIHYASASPRRRRELHGRLAELVDDAEERARHLALSVDGADVGVAAELEAAAEVARRRGATLARAELLDRAVALTPTSDGEARRRRALDAADASFAAGDAARARSQLERLLDETPPGSARGEVLLRLGTQLHAEDVRLAVDVLRQAEQEAGAHDALRARILVGLSSFVSAHLLGYEEVERYARTAVELAERAGDRATLARALTNLGDARFQRSGDLQPELLERAVRLEQESGRVGLDEHDPGNVYAAMLYDCDEHDRAQELWARLADEGRSTGDAGVAFPLTGLAWNEFDVGRWDAAREHAREALDISVQSGREAYEVGALSALGLVEAGRGEVEAAREHLLAGLALAERTGRGGRAPRYGLGLLELSLGDAAAAWAWLEPAVERILPVGITTPSAQVADAADALAGLGRTAESERLIAAVEEPARRLGRAWALAAATRARGLSLAAGGDAAAAEHVLQEAVALGSPLQRPLELGRSLLALGTVQRRLRHRQAARETLSRARDVFDQLGAPIWAERVRAELGRIGGRAPSAGELTPTESRVAELVAEGRSNKEVAAALFVTPRTVEFHLRNVFRKLELRSRAELVRRYRTQS